MFWLVVEKYKFLDQIASHLSLSFSLSSLCLSLTWLRTAKNINSLSDAALVGANYLMCRLFHNPSCTAKYIQSLLISVHTMGGKNAWLTFQNPGRRYKQELNFHFHFLRKRQPINIPLFGPLLNENTPQCICALWKFNNSSASAPWSAQIHKLLSYSSNVVPLQGRTEITIRPWRCGQESPDLKCLKNRLCSECILVHF